MRHVLLGLVLAATLGLALPAQAREEILIAHPGGADPIRIGITGPENGPDNILDIPEPSAEPRIAYIWQKPEYYYSEDRTVFYYRGPVEFELETVIETLLPSVRTLVLTSNGGYVEPAMRISGVIRQRGYKTYVPLYCYSACTFLFAAGVERVIDPGAELLVHGSMPTATGGSLAEQDERRRITAEINARMPHRLASLGVDLTLAIEATRLPRAIFERTLYAEDAVKYGFATAIRKERYNP
jgi:ATP-dependent protease ClpP protease subunit